MDPFTQRMLERARARQEKIDQKLASSGQVVTKRKPLSENVDFHKSEGSPVKSPNKTVKEAASPRKTCQRSSIPVKSPGRKSVQKPEQNGSASSQKCRSDVVVTKKEFKSPRNSVTRRNSDVSVEINIMHRDDIQIEVQVEEREVPVSVTYDTNTGSVGGVIVEEIEEDTSKQSERKAIEMTDHRSERPALRNNIKSRLDRLGNLYSDSPNLSSPIHRTEQEFTSETPPPADTPREVKPAQKDGKRKFGRLAALADQINNWEDDLTHHSYQPETTKKTQSKQEKSDKHDSSTLDVSIHSIKDINRVLDSTGKSKQSSKTIDSTTFKKPTTNECQKLDNKIVAQLEGEGYRRVSASQSRLVYDFAATRPDRVRQEPSGASTTLSATAAPKMATMVAGAQPVNTATVAKKPSIKKYKAPTPPQRVSTSDDNCESDIDKENNVVVDREENDNENECCVQTKPQPAEKPLLEKGSPAPFRRFAPKLNSNTSDRSSVLSKAAMFEAGSPKAKDPAEMSLRERKALFEKNKGVAIVPKAPFGQAPSVKTLHGDNKADNKPVRPVTVNAKTTPTKQNTASANSSRTNSKENIPDDTTSQSSLGGGIKGKLAALFNKEQTISETTIANKFKLEREREMDMLQNRFHSKPKQNDDRPDSDDEQSEHDPSEKAPLMGSTLSLSQVMRKPEVIANIPKLVRDDKAKSQISLEADVHLGRNDTDRVVAAQPVKRRSSQDSPVVLSVLDDVKRIKVNNSKKEAESNGAVTDQPRLYPHLSDIETDNSNQEYSECGGSSAGNITEKLNKSDDWADTSFGREVMNVVKKNNTSYKKAVRESSDSEQSACDSELDDMLDEALKEEGDGPTPPKLNKQGSLSSSSFVYSGAQEQFKSPLKAQPPPAPATPATPRDRGAELVHTVSFYRRTQNASSTPSTPMRVIRHASPDREPDAASEAAAAAAGVTTVRQRIKELQAEIAEQQTVISQASQALNLCASTIEFSGSTEQAEGERLLLLATHRRQACLHEMQRLQVEGAGVAAAAGMAALGVHALSVPLRRDYVRQLNADGAVGHHALLLIKCRDRVLATSMQRTLPPAHALTFPDEIRMDGLSSDFKVTVEVYLLQASKENLPHDVKYHISNKKSSSKLLTPKSKVSELKTPRMQSPAGPLAVRSPQFALHGYCIFALPQATRKTFTLNKVPAGSPLEGALCMDISARVRVPAPPAHAAFLTAFDDVSGLGAWHRRWFRLQAPRLAYWKYPDDVHKKMPIGDIDLSSVVSQRAVRAPRDLCARPNTILLETEAPAGLLVPDGGSLVYARRPDGTVVRRHLLAADTPRDRDAWLDCLNRALEYVRCCGADDE